MFLFAFNLGNWENKFCVLGNFWICDLFKIVVRTTLWLTKTFSHCWSALPKRPSFSPAFRFVFKGLFLQEVCSSSQITFPTEMLPDILSLHLTFSVASCILALMQNSSVNMRFWGWRHHWSAREKQDKMLEIRLTLTFVEFQSCFVNSPASYWR